MNQIAPSINWTRYLENVFAPVPNFTRSIGKPVPTFLARSDLQILVTSEAYFANLSSLIAEYLSNSSTFNFSFNPHSIYSFYFLLFKNSSTNKCFSFEIYALNKALLYLLSISVSDTAKRVALQNYMMWYLARTYMDMLDSGFRALSRRFDRVISGTQGFCNIIYL